MMSGEDVTDKLEAVSLVVQQRPATPKNGHVLENGGTSSEDGSNSTGMSGLALSKPRVRCG